MKVELFQKDATHPFPIAVFKNKNYREGQPCIQFGFGKGERTTTSTLAQAAAWPILGANTGTSLAMAADYFGFNIVAVQFSNIAEFGEIDYGYQQAVSYLKADPNQIHMLNHSQSGFNFSIWVAKYPDSAKRYATITESAIGDGAQIGTAQALADSGRPIWFFTSLVDRKDGTTPEATENLYRNVLKLNDNCWLTEFKTIDHNGILSAFVAAWGTPKGEPGGWSPINTGNAIGLNNPAVKSWYEWIFNNALNKSIRTPLDAPSNIEETPPIPSPVVAPKKIVANLYDDGTWEMIK
jgi:hypothetical protein